MDAYGTWEVTTEGDCEGRSVKRLGTFTGYFDEIAFALANKCYYTLEFKKINGKDWWDKTPKKNEVNVRIWDFRGNVKKYKEMLKDRDLFVSDSNFFESIKLNKNNPLSEDEMKAIEARKFLESKGFDVDKIKDLL